MALGSFHVVVCVIANALDANQWDSVVAGLGDRDMFPGLNHRFTEVSVTKSKKGKGTLSLRVGGRKANGGDVDLLMPPLMYLLAFHIRGRTNTLREEFVD